MRIYIQNKKKIKIFLPTAFLNILGWMFCAKMDPQEKKKTKRLIKDVCRFIKKYKKENGSFTLLDVEEKDGAKVKIIV